MKSLVNVISHLMWSHFKSALFNNTRHKLVTTLFRSHGIFLRRPVTPSDLLPDESCILLVLGPVGEGLVDEQHLGWILALDQESKELSALMSSGSGQPQNLELWGSSPTRKLDLRPVPQIWMCPLNKIFTWKKSVSVIQNLLFGNTVSAA